MPEAPLRVQVVDAGAWLSDCAARLPFRFGIVTMLGAPLCIVRVTVETSDGRRHEGFASDLLVPKWFEKDPDRSLTESWDCLRTGILETCAAAPAATSTSVFDHWHRLNHERVESWTGDRSWRLLLGQGVSLVERAMIDAVCRATTQPFHDAVRSGTLGFDGTRLGVSSADPTRAVRSAPLTRIHVRHTIGLLDPLDAEDVTSDPADGLPVTLVEAIERYGLTHFKIKICGDLDADAARLRRIGDTLARACATPPVCTLDGNEQFESIAQLRELLTQVRADESAAWLLGHVISIEQPLPRARTFDATANEGLAALCDETPVIIDEADADLDAFADAAAIGYRGVSVKNCKGVFRAIASAARCAASGGQLFQSSEDLTNVPVLALQQDLVTAASLGLVHCERNGHHYFDRLSHLPDVEQRAICAAHADLYGDVPPGVRIRRGCMTIGSLHQTAGYGYDGPIDLESRTPLADWTAAPLLEKLAQT